MNIRRVPLSPLATGEQPLSRELGGYVVKVLRLRAGDPFVVFDPEAATEADAVLVRDVPAVAKVGAVRAAERAMGRAVQLLQGLSKGDKPDQIVRAAVALGVKRLSFVRSERSIPGAELRSDRLRAVMLDAARQCGRGDLPELDEVLDLKDAAPRAGQWRFALDPQAERSLSEAVQGVLPDGDVTLAVGPEGGFSTAEYDWLVELGYRRVRLAPYVLRTELAAVAALAMVACHE